MKGGDLFTLVYSKKQEQQQNMSENQLAKMMYQICLAVQHLHRMGIAHRDLKPSNVLLESKDFDSNIKLCDFGFTKKENDSLQSPVFTQRKFFTFLFW